MQQASISERTQNYSTFIPNSSFGKLMYAVEYIFCREVEKGACDKERVNVLPETSMVLNEFAALATYEATCHRKEGSDLWAHCKTSGFFHNVCTKMVAVISACHQEICKPQQKPDGEDYFKFVNNKAIFLILLRSLHATIIQSVKDATECNEGYELFECGEGRIEKKKVLLEGVSRLISGLSPVGPKLNSEFPIKDMTSYFEEIIGAFEFLSGKTFDGETCKNGIEEFLLTVGVKLKSNLNTNASNKVMRQTVDAFVEKSCVEISEGMQDIKINMNKWEVLYILLDAFMTDIDLESSEGYALPNGWTIPAQALYDSALYIKEEYVLVQCGVVGNPHLPNPLASSKWLKNSQAVNSVDLSASLMELAASKVINSMAENMSRRDVSKDSQSENSDDLFASAIDLSFSQTNNPQVVKISGQVVSTPIQVVGFPDWK